VLLLVRRHYLDAIRRGEKRFEIRAGSKYRNIKPGDVLALRCWAEQTNVTVERVEVHETASTLPVDVSDCYPDTPGPFYVFHFRKDQKQ
jgi:ASC-1-like (ASCH) protein